MRRADAFLIAGSAQPARGMVFSPWEVRALRAGRKTESRRTNLTYRLRPQAGDRLWVKEGWVRDGAVCQVLGYLVDGARAGGQLQNDVPGLRMPRWASRFTLNVTHAWQEQLDDISWEGALAEGLLGATAGELRRRGMLSGSVLHQRGGEVVPQTWPDEMVLWFGAAALVPRLYPDPRDAFLDLWERLHLGCDPGMPVWVLRFSVEARNIDHLSKIA